MPKINVLQLRRSQHRRLGCSVLVGLFAAVAFDDFSNGEVSRSRHVFSYGRIIV